MRPLLASLPNERRRGRTLPVVVLALSGLVPVALLVFHLVVERGFDRGCEENLRRIHGRMMAYAADRGALPSLSLFPDDALTDPDSLYTVLAPYGVHADDCICPALARHLGEVGITYLWNANLNGKAPADVNSDTWMLVEVSALSRSVPPPHRGWYHVLYADGRLERSPRPPPGM